MKQQIFLSYSHKDMVIMQRVRLSLKGANFPVWTDENIKPGTSSWQIAVEKAITDSASIVCILTPNAKDSHWVREELNLAQINGKAIFLLLAQGDVLSSSILGFTASQWLDIRSPNDYSTQIQKLINTLQLHNEAPSSIGNSQTIQSLNSVSFTSADGFLSDTAPSPAVDPFPVPIPKRIKYYLEIRKGEVAKTLYIQNEILNMGRANDNDFVIDDREASRYHCRIVHSEEGFVIIDLGSKNGTYVNSFPAIPYIKLKEDDIIKIGSTIMIFKILANLDNQLQE